jgi:hypothetical protein
LATEQLLFICFSWKKEDEEPEEGEKETFKNNIILKSTTIYEKKV